MAPDDCRYIWCGACYHRGFENACLGAAVLGLYALGENKDFSDLNQMIPIGKESNPPKLIINSINVILKNIKN